MELRPNAFYELTDGCQLTFADIVCQYFFGPPPEEEEEEVEGSYEQTQAYLGQENTREEEDEVKEAANEEEVKAASGLDNSGRWMFSGLWYIERDKGTERG